MSEPIQNAVVPAISQKQLKGIESFDDALELLKGTYGESALETASDALGDGFALTDNKDQFIGKPLILVHWSINVGDFIDQETGELGKYVVARVVTQAGKYLVIDGGSGIAHQLITYTAETGKTFLVAQKGLRRSDYTKEGIGEATTYYVDTTAVES
jgi:hypothetical protein